MADHYPAMSKSAEEAYRRFEPLRASYQTCIKQFDDDDAHIRASWNTQELKDKIIPDGWEDEGLEITAPPTAYNAVENAADHILSRPTISVPERPDAKNPSAARELSENMRVFLEMWWDRIFSESGDPVGRGKKEMVKGKLVWKLNFKWDMLPDYPDEDASQSDKDKWKAAVERLAKREFLWDMEVVPRQTFFEDPARRHDPGYGYEFFELPTYEVLARYPDNDALYEHLKDNDPTSMVRFLEYWERPRGKSRGKFIQYVEHVVVHEAFNPFSWEISEGQWTGFIPYIVGNPGWGHPDEKNKPEDVYVSIVTPMKSVAQAETRFLTEMESYLRMYVWPHLVTKNMPSLPSGEKQIRLGPGGHTDTTEQQEMEVLKWGDIPQSLMAGLDRVNQYADEASRFGALGGNVQKGVDTASEADLNSRNAATKLSGPVRSLRLMMTIVNRMVLQTVENVLEHPVTVFGSTEFGPSAVTVKPKDIKGYYFTGVELSTSDEASLDLRRARIWQEMSSTVPVSYRTVLKNAGVKNPSKEMQERMLEDLERSPEALQTYLTMILSGLGAEGQVIAQRLLAGGTSPSQEGGGAPPQTPLNEIQNPVEQSRNEARDEAIAAAPERALS